MWGLSNVDRVDVHQADVCALMSALIGTPFPVNSHGIIPLEYIDSNGERIGSGSWSCAAEYLALSIFDDVDTSLKSP